MHAITVVKFVYFLPAIDAFAVLYLMRTNTGGVAIAAMDAYAVVKCVGGMLVKRCGLGVVRKIFWTLRGVY